ncbi:MAG: Histidinol-phosphate aminotransferase [Verrucomicrobia subdivision 3 bacterium]|nr:Histidinol-phosphate aminotransferase [Limisphaerales bacterium]MCS1416453.1 Histidinol-phosphate aminotransferase [Limisphaerales bacterium]
MLKLSSTLESLPVYQPGRPIKEVACEQGFAPSEVATLASNENPLGPSPLAIQAMREAVATVNLYPDGNAFYLKRRLGEALDVAPSNIILGNGSNELIEFVGHALLGPGTKVVVSQYCFAIYPIVAKLFGADVVTVPAVDYGSDVAAMAKAVNEETRILFVANPNNPTGTLVPEEAILKLIETVPGHVLVVIDEAYIEYLDNPLDLLPRIRKGKPQNLLLMRTFSKIHGLAGLRLGYGLGCDTIVGALEKIRQPFNTNSIAQAAALAALDDVAHVEESRRHNRQGIEMFESFCRERGWLYVPSFANFVLIQVGDGSAVCQSLLKQGIIARPMDGYGLNEWLRISIGTAKENQRCLEALVDVTVS